MCRGNVIIRRDFIREGNKNRWQLQNKVVREKDIEDMISSMGIQMNNLCQFLPQDRVVEFAKLNKMELLSSTETAVGEMELAEMHRKLSQTGLTLQDMNNQVANLRSQLSTEISKNDQLKDQVRNIELKEELDKDIKERKLLILYCKYNEKQAKYKQYKHELKILTKACSEIDSRMEPNLIKKKKLVGEMAEFTGTTKTMNEEGRVFRLESEAFVSSWEKKDEEIVLAREEFEESVKTNEKRMKEISDLNRQLEALVGNMQNMEIVDEQLLSREIMSLGEQITAKSSNVVAIQSKCDEFTIHTNAINEEKRNIERDLNKARDIRTRRLDMLKTRNPDVFAAANWLHNNMGLFQGTVHEPLFTVIDFTDKSYADYLENTVSNQDLIAFVCENKYDINVLKRHADSYRWSINILHAPLIDPNNIHPTYPIESLRPLGFDSYIRDKIIAPPAIIGYLCSHYNIHNIPCAKTADDERVPSAIPIFFIGRNRYAKRKSRYDQQVSVNVSEIRPVYYFSLSSDPGKEEHLQRKLQELEERLNAVQKSLYDLKRDEGNAEKELELLRHEKQRKMSQIDQRKQLQTRITQKQELIRRRETNKIDLKLQETRMKRRIKDAIKELRNIAVKHSDVENRATALCKTVLKRTFHGAESQQKLRRLNKAMEDDENEKQQKMEEHNTLSREQKECTEMAKLLINDLVTTAGYRNVKEIPEEVMQGWCRTVNRTTLEELENTQAEKVAHRNCIITSEDSVIDEYKQREAKIAKLRAEEEKINNSIDTEMTAVDSCRERWLTSIHELTSRINDHFSEFMANLGCAGEVQIEKGADENDFSKYGLAIRVKFRDTEKLKDLTAHQQSGGERSVSTALYLMALQTLKAVPFRCVDEINQGMDPSNERAMFRMLLDTTTNDTSSQYFLVTPKLLPSLPYNRYVNVMTVFNWSSVNSRHLSSSRLLKYHKIKRRKRQKEAANQ